MGEIAERLRAEETRMERLFDLVTEIRDRPRGVQSAFADMNQIKHAVSGRDPVLTLAADEIDRLAAENAALREERDRLREALEFQPMETAPKGQDIVALVDEGWGYGPKWRVIHWNDGIGKAAYTWPCWMCSTCTIQMDEKRFKGWLHLPDARAALSKGEG